MSTRNQVDENYHNGLQDIISNGVLKTDRTGTGTLSTFGRLRRYDVSNNSLPLITTKKIFTRSFVHETIWFISGSTNIKYLKDNNVSIWDSWLKDGTVEVDEEGNILSGDIGKGGYGESWRRKEDTRMITYDQLEEHLSKGFEQVVTMVRTVKYPFDLIVTRYIDKLQNAVNLLRNDPDSRRIIVDAYDSAYVDFAMLAPCHSLFQFYSKPVENGKRKLSLLLYLRSNDAPVGEPFNLPQYSLLLAMIAHITNHVTDEIIYVNGDHHIYLDQVEMVKEQLQLESYENNVKIEFTNDPKELEDLNFDDIKITGYNNFHPSIKYPVAI